MTNQLVINLVYDHLQPIEMQAVHRHNVTVLITQMPVMGCDIYAYLNAYSFKGVQPGLNILLLFEPITVLPGQYDDQIWNHFDYILTHYDKVIERNPEKFKKVLLMRTGFIVDLPVTENIDERKRKYPLENRSDAICMINGNKISLVPGEGYSKRIEAALWFHQYSDIPFDVFGNPPFSLPNYKGILDWDERIPTLVKYKYGLAFENLIHPEYSVGYVDKIFDCLESRTIPIYLGALDVNKYVPEMCYIDFRNFKNYQELDKYLHSISDQIYHDYIRNIDHWICQGGLRPYSTYSIYEKLVEIFSLNSGKQSSDFLGVNEVWSPGFSPTLGNRLWLAAQATPYWNFQSLASTRTPLIDYEQKRSCTHREIEERLDKVKSLQEKNKPVEAALEMEKILAEGAFNAATVYLYSQLLVESGDFEKGHEQLEKVILLDPRHSLALNDIAALYTLKKDFKKAVEYYHAAIQTDHHNYIALENLLSLLKALKIKDYAFAFTQSLLAQSPDNPRLREILLKFHLPTELQQKEMESKFINMASNLMKDKCNYTMLSDLIDYWQKMCKSGFYFDPVRIIKNIYKEGIFDIGEKKAGSLAKKALIIYVMEPIPWYVIDRLNEFPYLNSHTMFWESIEMIKILNRCGFIVDYIGTGSQILKNSSFDWNKYDLIIDGGENNLCQVPADSKAVKVYYSTGKHWQEANRAELNRIRMFSERHGIGMPANRMQGNSFSDENADYLTYFGNESQLQGFHPNSKKIPLNISSICIPGPRPKNIGQSRKNFIWLGGSSMIHKGLDLVVDAFRDIPDLTLHIGAYMHTEPEFYDWLKPILEINKNIIFYGAFDVTSTQFSELAWNCIGTIYVSAAEGGPGSVAQLLHFGVIPIVTKSSNVRAEHLGYIIEDESDRDIIGSIKKYVHLMANSSREELQIKSRAVQEFAMATHTREAYSRSFESLLMEIEKDIYSKDVETGKVMMKLSSLDRATNNFRPVKHRLALVRIKSPSYSLTPEFLQQISEIFQASVFVETGTFLGGTTLEASRIFKSVYTVELSEALYRQAQIGFAGKENIRSYLGDSGKLLQEILKNIKGKTIFWLDGHYSEGVTARSDKNSPIMDELKSIKKADIMDSIILIDDLRVFPNSWTRIPDRESLKGYPTIPQLLQAIQDINSSYTFVVLGDALLAYPGTTKLTLSPVLTACTFSRLFEGLDDEVPQVIEAEKIIGKATDDERLVIQTLSDMAPTEFFGLGEHLHLWKALTLMAGQQDRQASEVLQAVIRGGFTHWRIRWYLSQAAYNSGDIALARKEIYKVLREKPDFRDAQILREDIDKQNQVVYKNDDIVTHRIQSQEKDSMADDNTIQKDQEFISRKDLRSFSENVPNTAYVRVVKECVANYEAFSSFKRNPNYQIALEHLSPQSGHDYLEKIKTQDPEILSKIDLIKMNDMIGSPFLYKYDSIGKISPTTLRYAKVASDLKLLYGDLTDFSIVEIGCGYGGQMLIIDQIYKIKKYLMFDLPPVLELIQKYLESHLINSSYRTSTLNQFGEDEEFDLVISNYAFSELPRLLQKKYIEKILSKSKRGYLTMNTGLTDSEIKDHLNVYELKSYLPNIEILPEQPLTGAQNYIICWGQKKKSALIGHKKRINTFCPASQEEMIEITVKTDSPVFDTTGYNNDNIMENGELNVLSKILKNGDLIFDVGANIGKWSKLVLERHPDTKIYAFEPVPETFCILKKMINGSNIFLNNIAISNEDGGKTFYHWTNSSELGEMSSLYRRFKIEKQMNISIKPITVRSRTLDSFCKKNNINHIDFLKIDTEGAELDVVKGAINLLNSKSISAIQFEYGGCYSDSGITLKQIFELLRHRGYHIFRIIPDGLLHISYWREALENYQYANYIATIAQMKGPSEKTIIKDVQCRTLDRQTVAIVFSKNRAMQLDCMLRSFYLHCKDSKTIDLKVLYTTSSDLYERQYSVLREQYLDVEFIREKQFKEDLLVIQSLYDYILFLVDDSIFVADFSINEAILALEKTYNALGVSLRLGNNTTYSYMLDRKQTLPSFEQEGEGLLFFDWTISEMDFGYPLEVSSSIYRVADLQPFLQDLDFINPNTLELQMDVHKSVFMHDKNVLLCFPESRCFCNPVNMVQTAWINRAGGKSTYTSDKLRELFDQGLRINLNRFSGYMPNSCHDEMELEFIAYAPVHEGAESTGSTLKSTFVTIGIANYNGIQHMQPCLESIRRNTPEPHEIIVVDNGSTDGSREYLRDQPDIILVENSENMGAPGARNQFMAISRGDYIVFLDNDTIVTEDWLKKLINHMERDSQIGIIGACTNYATGLQGIPGVTYNTLEELEAYARRRAEEYRGVMIPSPRLISFCVFVRKAAVVKIGGMETGFSKFCFEDDDYSLRITIAGYQSVVANDVFIHHTGGPQGRGDQQYNKWLFDAWDGFKRKWGLPEDLSFGANYNLEKLIKQPFDPQKHYIPLPDPASVEKLVYTNPLEKRINDVFSSANHAAVEGRWDEAVGALQTLLKENPDQGVAHAGLGSILIAKGDYPAAVTHLNQAVQLLPDEVDIKAQLAEALYFSGDKPSAIQTLLTALEHAPDNVNLLLKLIDILWAENQIDQAAGYTLRAVKISPDNPEVLVAFGRLGIDSDNHEAFQAAFDKLKQISPDHPILKEWHGVLSRPENTQAISETQADNAEEGFTPDKIHVRKPRVIEGLASIIIVLSAEPKNLKQCLKRIQKHTPEPHEVIIIGKEGEDWATKGQQGGVVPGKNLKCLLTDKLAGLAESYNQGMKESSGDHIVLMSDEVLVTKDWLSGLLECLSSKPDLGLVGPMTVNGNGPQFVTDAAYKIDDLDDYAEDFRARYRHQRIPVLYPSPVCLCLKWEVIEQVGLLDESLSKGGVEFDDFCNRIALEGYGLAAAGDVFIHNTNGKRPLKNKSLLKEKWSGIDAQTDLGKKMARFNAFHGAQESHQKGKNDKAVEALIEGLKYCPDEKTIYYALAEILIDAKRFSDALEVLNGLPEKAKEESKSLALFGYCQECLGHPDEAEGYADRVLLRQPDDPLALNLKGLLLHKKGDRAAAEKFFKKAIQSDPGYGEPYTNLGELKWQAGEKEEAFDLFKKGVILSPTNADILSLYQTAAIQLGKHERAEKVLENAKAHYPKHKRLAFSLISVLLAQGKLKEAIREIEGAVITFGLDDGLLAASLEVRDKIGPMEVSRTAPTEGTLSVCMIVKNEEEHLARCLMSLKPVADEIIVVDTGSTDRTKDMARAFGAKVYDFKWTEDFSEARNYSLSKAAGKWVLVHDADEVLSPLDYDRLRKILDQQPANSLAYSIITRNYSTNSSLEGWTANVGEYPQEEAGTGWFPTPKVRLFPNDPRIRFQNPVHELLEPSLMRAEFNIRPLVIPIHHYGELNQEKDLSKAKTYYQLGKKKLEASPNNPIALRELAIQAGELKKYSEALDLFQKYLKIVPDSHVAYFNMATCYLELENFEQALEAAKKAKELAPGSNEALLSYAGVSLCTGDIIDAISTLEGLLKKVPEYPVARTVLAAGYCIGGQEEKGLGCLIKLKQQGYGCDPVLHSLSKKLFAAGRIDQARRLLQGMIKSGHVHPETQALLAQCETLGKDEMTVYN